MRRVPRPEFLAWVGESGIGVDPEWARNLTFLSDAVEPRYWLTPKDQRGLDDFIGTLFHGLGDFDTLFVWAKSGGWLTELEEQSTLCRLARSRLEDATDSSDAIGFERAELDLAALLVMCSATAGWSWPSDLFILTDRRDAILMVDHHGCVWAQFTDQPRCDRFVAELEAEGYALPAAPPDWTFRRVSWMKPPDPS